MDYIDIIQCHDIEFGALQQLVEETLPGEQESFKRYCSCITKRLSQPSRRSKQRGKHVRVCSRSRLLADAAGVRYDTSASRGFR